MKTQRLEILAASISLDRFSGQYRAVFTSPGGRVFRRLGIEPSPGVTHWTQEPPERMLAINNAACIISNALADEGAFSARGNQKFKNVMQEYTTEGRRHRRNTGFESHARAALSVFGEKRISAITRADVRAWITDMEQEFSSKTISNRVDTARACFSWLIKEEKFSGANPFAGHEWHSNIEGRAIKPTITPAEFQFIVDNINPRARQAAIIGYYTGLRPFEVCAVQSGDISHENLFLEVRVAKSRKRAATRRIAIPGVLSAHIINTGFTPMNRNTVSTGFERFRKQHPEFAGLCMESFRHNFSNMLRVAGVPRDVIDVHQGRTTNVQDRNYNTDDPMFAVNVMRPWIAAVFDGADRAKFALVRQ